MKIKRLLMVLLGSLLLGSTSQAASLLITNGLVFTGDDTPPNQLDILIEDGLIEAVASDLSTAEADQVIDAAGRPVTDASSIFPSRPERRRSGRKLSRRGETPTTGLKGYRVGKSATAPLLSG